MEREPHYKWTKILIGIYGRRSAKQPVGMKNTQNSVSGEVKIITVMSI